MSLNTEQMADTPLALWRASDGVDHSGNGHDLTPFGSPTDGVSLDLSSSDPSIVLVDGSNLWNPGHSASFDLAGSVSLSFLMRATTVGAANLDLVRKWSLYGAYLGTDGKVHAVLQSATTGAHDLAGSTTIVANTTYHVGVVYDGSTVKVYVDGVLDGTLGVTGAIDVDNTQAISVGTSGLVGFDGIAGRLDEVALYSHALAADRFAAHATAALGGGGGGGGSVLWVNADHAAASDAGDRAAALNPDTPLKTIERACVLALAGDTIKVLPAAAADPTNTNDARVYAIVVSGLYGESLLGLAEGVTVEAFPVDGVRPRWLGLHAADLVGWTVRGFQIGYDLGSTHEYNTNCTLIGAVGFTCEDVVFTGGGYQLLAPRDVITFTNCTITAKVRPTPVGFLEGNGFRLAAAFGYEIDPDARVEWHFCTFDTLQGEDAIQAAFGGALTIEDCTFDNIVQTSELHTDAIQTFGATTLRVARCKFGYTSLVSSMIIASDGHLERLELENNLFVGRPGSGFLTQFSGVASWLVRHNTWVGSGFAGLRFYTHDNPRDTYSGVVHSNVIDNFQVDIPTSGAGVTWEQHHNVIGIGYATVDDYNVFAEFGTSTDTDWELANAGGILSAGIDQAWDADPDPLLTDRLGRPRQGDGPDCGCHESSLSVTASPRAPIIVSFSPPGGTTNVSRTVAPSVVLFPKPGESIDATTVDEDSVTLVDSDGHAIPASSVTVGAVDGSGYQTITLDPAGTLWRRVGYTFAISGAIEDTEGSAVSASSASWRTTGGAVPAIDAGGAPVGGGWTVGALI